MDTSCIPDVIGLRERELALARFCCSRNHFSISLTRKSCGATNVWKTKVSPFEDVLAIGRVVLAIFWHLRIILSFRCRISMMRSQETEGFLDSSYVSSFNNCSYIEAVPGGSKTYINCLDGKDHGPGNENQPSVHLGYRLVGYIGCLWVCRGHNVRVVHAPD